MKICFHAIIRNTDVCLNMTVRRKHWWLNHVMKSHFLFIFLWVTYKSVLRKHYPGKDGLNELLSTLNQGVGNHFPFRCWLPCWMVDGPYLLLYLIQEDNNKTINSTFNLHLSSVTCSLLTFDLKIKKKKIILLCHEGTQGIWFSAHIFLDFSAHCEVNQHHAWLPFLPHLQKKMDTHLHNWVTRGTSHQI